MDYLVSIEFPTAQEVSDCFYEFDDTDLFDLSAKGEKDLDGTISIYGKKIVEIEKKVCKKISFIFSNLKSDNEKFKYYKKFIFFFKRDFVRKELMNLNDNLLKVIESDQRKIIESFRNKNEKQSNPALLKKINMPSGIYKHIWIEQLIRAVHKNNERLKLILDDKVTQDPRSRELSQMSESFLKQISKVLEDNFVTLDQAYQSKQDEKVLGIKAAEGDKKTKLMMNFNTESKRSIKIMKYFYILKPELNKKYYLKYVFTTVNLKSYHLSYYVKEGVNTFNTLVQKMTPIQTKLLAKLLKDCYKRIEFAQNMTWFAEENGQFNSKIERFTLQFAIDVVNLEENALFVSQSISSIENSLDELSHVDRDVILMEQKIKSIQSQFSEFRNKNYKNLNFYMNEINTQVQKLIMNRLETIIKLWTEEFNKFDGDKCRKYLSGEHPKHDDAGDSNSEKEEMTLFKEMILYPVQFCYVK